MLRGLKRSESHQLMADYSFAIPFTTESAKMLPVPQKLITGAAKLSKDP